MVLAAGPRCRRSRGHDQQEPPPPVKVKVVGVGCQWGCVPSDQDLVVFVLGSWPMDSQEIL